jgi:hypothetical protein
MDSAKKQHERFLLDRFLELQGITPTDIVPREHPDFLIDLEGRKVGIEVTELSIRSRSKGHPRPDGKPFLQDIESITNQIVSTARKPDHTRQEKGRSGCQADCKSDSEYEPPGFAGSRLEIERG